MISRAHLEETVMCDRKHYDLFYEIGYEKVKTIEKGKEYISYREDEETGRLIETSRTLKVNLPEIGEEEIGFEDAGAPR